MQGGERFVVREERQEPKANDVFRKALIEPKRDRLVTILIIGCFLVAIIS